MAHGLTNSDTMFSVREMPWHGLGTILPEPPKTMQEALVASGLDWSVQPGIVTVTTPAGVVEATEFKANVRESDGSILGIVSRDYREVQNRDAFGFLDNLIGSEMHYETAGSLYGGKRVWVLAKLPEYIEIGGDQAAQYVYIANSHDGSMAVTAAATTVRIVCANTLGFALGKDVQRQFKLRHTGNLERKIHDARNVMEMTLNYQQQFKELGDKLALEPISEADLMTRLKKLFPITDTDGNVAQRNRERSRAAVLAIFKGEAEFVNGNGERQLSDAATVGNAPGTKWCALNAISEYADFGRRVTVKTNQVQRSFEDSYLKQKGLEVMLAN